MVTVASASGRREVHSTALPCWLYVCESSAYKDGNRESAGGRISPGDRQYSAGGRHLVHWKLKVSFGRIFSSTSVVAWGVNDLSARRTTGEMEKESERSEVIYEAGKKYSKCVNAGLRRKVGEIRAFFWGGGGYYAAYGGSSLQTHRDNLSFPSSRVELEDGTDGCPEMSIRNNHYTRRNIPEERRSRIQYFFAVIFRSLAHSVANCGADQQSMKWTTIKIASIKLQQW